MTTPLSAFVRIRGRFHRSVNLRSDWTNPRSLTEFIPTRTIVSLAERICTQAVLDGGVRAWSLTGPYGAGKSAFALFLSDILANKRSRHPESQRIRAALNLRTKEFHPVLITAERGPLADSIRSALSATRRELTGARARDQGVDIPTMLGKTAEDAKRRRKAGVLLIIDELGKFLEFAASNPADADVFLLQQLAEEAARSAVPFILVTILHSGFADYLPAAEEVRRNEWQKVQGRFQDVAYQLPADQVLDLIATAIEVDAPAALSAAWAGAVHESLPELAFHEVTYRAALERTAIKCVPVHPLTLALLWPVFRGKGAQNERSLFSFLTSNEPFGFEAWLENTVADPASAPMYRLPRLYDYITHALGIGAFRGERARRWALVDETLNRLPPDAPNGAADVVKGIGLVELLGGHAGVRADRRTIAESVGASIDTAAVLQFLEDRSLVVFRRHLDAFGLWEGSDFDLEVAYQTAYARARQSGSLARQMEHLFPPRPWVIQRHYLNTGTMRFFEVMYADDAELASASLTEEPTEADGRLIFVLPLSTQLELSQARRSFAAQDSHGKPIVVAISRETGSLAEDLRDVEAWDYVSHHSPELAADHAARQEVRARLVAARERLERKIGPQLGLPGHLFNPSLAKWSYGEATFQGTSLEQFKQWLSGILDKVYSKAPVLKNELLNRAMLSSAASKARRNLLEAMLIRAGRAGLGFAGYPPERSMYESMLLTGGFHREDASGWRFGAPRKGWLYVYREIDQFIRSATSSRRRVSDLYDRLTRPPFGMREGPLPVLFLGYLLGRVDEVGLYEEGVLVPELRTEVVERLLRRPELFEVRDHQLTPEQIKALVLLAGLASSTDPGHLKEHPERALIPVVRSLIGFVTGLPPFSRQTRRLEPHDALAVRDLLLSATDPARLLFVDLPGALSIESVEGQNGVVFVERLRGRLRALARAYPALLDDVEQQIRSVFDLSGTSDAAYTLLQKRAHSIQPFAVDQRLRTFVLEATRELGGRDWREALARALKEGSPPTHWKDHDIATFQVRLREIASDFHRLEELAMAQGSGTRRVVRIGVLDEAGRETRRVIPINDSEDPSVLRLMGHLRELLRRHGDGSADDLVTQLEALCRVAVDLMLEPSQSVEEV